MNRLPFSSFQVRSPWRERIRKGELSSPQLFGRPDPALANADPFITSVRFSFSQSTFLQSIAERDIEIPDHIDVRTP